MELGDPLTETEEPRPSVLAELSTDEQFDALDRLYARVIYNPEMELTQEEASLVYSVDQDLANEALQTLAEGIKKRRGLHEQMSDEEIRQLRDYEQVKSLIIERLRSEKNVIQTVEALSNICDGLGIERFSPADYINALREKMAEWEERGVFDYLAIELIKNNSRHNIVPVPNTEFEYEQIITLADTFNNGHQVTEDELEISIKKKIDQYCSQFSPSELSGPVTDPDQPIRLRLLPSMPNPEFDEYKGFPELVEENIPKMLKTLTEITEMRPNLNVEVPSILEGIAFAFTLQSLGELPDSHAVITDKVNLFNKTHVNAFNLQPRVNNNSSQIPFTFIDAKGNLRLTSTLSTHCIGARLSIG